jgi:hypothetical protein
MPEFDPLGSFSRERFPISGEQLLELRNTSTGQLGGGVPEIFLAVYHLTLGLGATILPLALTPRAAMLTGTQRTAPVPWVQKPFDRITGKENLEVVAALFSQLEKALPHGCGKVSNVPGAHTIDSR